MTETDNHRPTVERPFGHHPALDGVRAVAIGLVVLFHYKWGYEHLGDSLPFHGGFLGVDAFFVLSGFLITTLLLHEHTSRGSVGLRAFYARRAFRLLPALALLLAGLIVLYVAKNPQRPSLGGLFGIVFYVANWVQIHGAKQIGGGPLGFGGATWSLAVEEQFYILWPIALLLLLRKRLRLGTVAIAIAVGIAASAGWRAWLWHQGLAHRSPNALWRIHWRIVTWYRVYLGSDTRADALLVGCLTAILAFWLLPRLGKPARTLLTVAAVLALGAGAVMVNSASEFQSDWLPEWGFLAFAVTSAIVIVALVASPRSPLTRVFAIAPLTWVGRRSYAIYLFHPFVLLYASRKYVHLAPQLSFAFQMAVIFILADLSFRLVEAPMLRRKQRFDLDAESPATEQPAPAGLLLAPD